MEPVLSKLRAKIQVKFAHLRINVRKHPFIVEYYYVIREPCYLFFYNGELIDRIEGLISFNKFELKISEHINNLKLNNNEPL
jgi:hypothetical protein